MMKTTIEKGKISAIAILFLFFVFVNSSYGQEKALWQLTPQELSNSYGVSRETWDEYTNKTNLFLKEIDEQSFINYVILSADGELSDRKHFLDYSRKYIQLDKSALIYKVGKNEIVDVAGVKSYYASLQPKYLGYYKAFLDNNKKIEAIRKSERTGRGPLPVPFNCGSPCTNPGFESGNGFWDYSYGDACASSSASDPCNLTAGFNTSAHDLTTVADGYDPVVGGTILPVVPPGGGNNAMMLGDGADFPDNGALTSASRASISFTVSATNANFTYRYAVVFEDSGHSDPERPYFMVKVRDAAGNVVQCGDYFVSSRPPVTDFTETSAGSGIWYRNWTTVFIPLQGYIGQCVTIEFTASDCSVGGHFGYAYIDADCDPLQLLSSSPTVCGGSSVTLTAPAGGVAYAWTNTAGGTTGIVGSTTGQTAVVNQAGTYQVAITMVSGPACIATLNITVGSSPLNPVAAFTNTTVCVGTATQFTDTSTPTGSITAWSWDFNNDGTEDSNAQNPSFTFAGAGTYPVTLTITMGPCNATITQNVTVNSGTPPIINAAGPFCSNAASVTLTANATGGTWSGTGITNAATGAFDPAAATVGNNVITYTISGACGGSDTETIVVNALPTSNAGTDVTICTGSAGNIGTANTPGYTYSWGPTTGLSSPSISNPTVTLTNVGTIPTTSTYTVTTTSNGCTSTDAVDVIVNPLATANAGPAQTICAGSTATLAGAVGGAATSGTWGGGAGTFTPNNNTLNAVYTPSAAEVAAGSVTLTLVSNDPAGPCPVATSTVTITINPVATIDAGADQTTCIGGSITLAAITGGGATSGTWSGGTGTFAPNNTTANAVYTPSAAEEAAGTVTLTYTSNDPAGPCPSVNDQMVITITALPTVSAGLDQTICNGTTATLAGTIGGAATSATWSGGTGTFAPNNTALNAVYTPSAAENAAGTVTLTLTTNDPNGPCVAVNDQMTITINPIATIDAGPDQTVCIGSTVTLAGVIGGSATSGTWSGGTGTFAPSAAAANAVYTPSAAENAAGTVTLTFTSDDPIGPCSSVNDQMVITINQLPTANAGITQSVCSGATITLGGSIGGSATSGTWSGGTGSFFPNNTTLNAVYTPSAAELAAGSVTLTLTTNDPAGPCNAVTATVTHNFYQNPVVTFTVDDPNGCPVHCVQFTDLTTVGGGDNITNWEWNFGDGSPLDGNQNPAHCFSATGLYDITLTATSNHGCTTTLTINDMIEVFANPVAEFTTTPNPASILDSTVYFINQSSADVVTWDWNYGDGSGTVLNAPNSGNTVNDYPAVEATYIATLIVTNANGCMDSVQHTVIVGPEFTFYIPNAFTPNGDNINDFFFGQGIGIVEYDIWIFDRWGNMIFHGDELNDYWDGRANNGAEVAQQDVYVWKVQLKDVFGKKHNYLGTVTLVK